MLRAPVSLQGKPLIETELQYLFIEFIDTFTKDQVAIYKVKSEQLLHKTSHLLVISFGDIMGFSTQLWDAIVTDFYKYESKLNECFTNYMHQIDKNNRQQNDPRDPNNERRNEDYYIAFDHLHGDDLKNLKCGKLGKLVAFKGTVTRTCQVRPEIKRGVFKCLGCQQPSHEVEQQFKYTQPKRCATANCAANKWELLPGQSHFNDFQKIRVQDDPSELYEGGMPKSIEVILRNDLCDTAQPGDNCTFTGMLCVVPEIASMLRPGERTQITSRNMELDRGNSIGLEGVTGLKQTGVRDLNYKLVFMASYVRVENSQFKQDMDEEDGADTLEVEYSDEREIKKISKHFPLSTQEKISQIVENPNKYQALAESLFPSIYGHSEIKKAVLLQLFSGVHKTTSGNKISIRGDINILIVGDPSTSKSMFLKCIESFVPRAVYTNGKTTSAAGLTATVTRDDNGDVGLEAGALMLADNGVCCIDQFDKMDTKDQVAIHEAMEQQTISIAKAGIYATLNARTSILAAANPIFGRYDKSKALKHNINLSAPIMSRFDLFFVICDEPDALRDTHISDFILSMHRDKQKALERTYELQDIRDYIRFARKIMPRLTIEAAQLLTKCYKELRLKQRDSYSSYRVTVRQLESMIRISQALARLNLSVLVLPQHVQQAYRLISICIVKLQKSDVNLEEEQNQLTTRFGELKIGEDVFDPENLIQKQQKQENQKKPETKKISISYQIYMGMQKSIIELFNQKMKLANQHRTQEQINNQLDDESVGLSQNDVIDFLLSLNLETMNSMEQMNQTRKLMGSLVKKLIENEMLLYVLRDDPDPNNRILALHPNFQS